MEHKVWWVLAWYQYYPGGGLNNVHSTHYTEDEANDVAERLRAEGNYDYAEVENISRLLGIKDWSESGIEWQSSNC